MLSNTYGDVFGLPYNHINSIHKFTPFCLMMAHKIPAKTICIKISQLVIQNQG